MKNLSETDPKIHAIIAKEAKRQEEGIELIASENYTSPAVMEACGSVLTNKYSEGYVGKRYYGGNEVIDEMEALGVRLTVTAPTPDELRQVLARLELPALSNLPTLWDLPTLGPKHDSV